MKRTMVGLAIGGFALVALGSTPVGAIHELEIPIDTVVRGEPGEVIEVVAVEVEPDEIGAVCQVTITGRNNPSPHPNNDLLITSGGSTLVVPDVEAEPDQTTIGGGEIVLGGTVVIEMRLGDDGLSSAGLTLTSECAGPEPTTTTAPTTTTPEVQVLAEVEVLPETAPAAATVAQPTFTG